MTGSDDAGEPFSRWESQGKTYIRAIAESLMDGE
jgi:hypothetical protein